MSPLHVILVGHGMVGARFAEEVRGRDPEGRRVRLTILTAEPRPAYNRVLLPHLLSGVMREEDFTATAVAGLPLLTGEQPGNSQNGGVLHPDAPMTLRISTQVIGIDPRAKTVLVESTAAGPPVPSTRDRGLPGARTRNGSGAVTAAAGLIGYDVLVLATGARAAIPPLPGLLADEGNAAENRPPFPGRARAGGLLPGAVGETPASPHRSQGRRAQPRAAAADAGETPASPHRSKDSSLGARPLGPGEPQASDAGPLFSSPGPSGLVPGPAETPRGGGAAAAGFPSPAGEPAHTGNGRAAGGAGNRSGDRLHADVAALHSLADARHIAAFAQAARRAGGRIAVLGGGVLGLEAARALAAHGTAVTVVHRGGHLMERQLDAAAGRVLADAVRRTGVDVLLDAGAARWESGRGLWLLDGQLVGAAGLVLCTGTAPCAELARDAGLRLTEGGAIAVDDTLATSVPGVYAIGDCAGHPGAAGGLVQPGWEQAAVLASRLTGAAPKARYRGSGAVTRLKAAGIELTAVGTPGAGDADGSHGSGPSGEPEVLRFEDRARERYAKLVLSDDRVIGAVLIGLPDAAAGIVQLYDRDAPAPADRLALLLGRALPPEAGGGATGPAALPDYAVMCRCNMVTKGQLRDAWYRGACGRDALSAATRAATGCGTCGNDLDAVAAWLAETDPSPPGAREPATASQAGPPGGRPDGPDGGQSADPQQKEAALR